MMLDVGVNIITTTVGIVLATVLVIGLASILFSKRMPEDGLLQYYFYAVLLAAAISMLFSPRDFVNDGEYYIDAIQSNPLAEWSIRFASLFTMLAALERSVNFLIHNAWTRNRTIMLFILTYFWITNLFIPSFIISNKNFEISLFYSLVLSVGITLSFQIKQKNTIIHARNALFLFTLASFLFIFISPNSALDFNYAQGYIPGLPRLAGLAPHATTMSIIVVLALWTIIAHPFLNSKFQWFSLFICLIALILTQSKTVIFSFIVGYSLIAFYKNKTLFNSEKLLKIKLYIFSFSSLIALTLTTIFLTIDLEKALYINFSQETINNIITFTGRDVIWEVALIEFNKSPLFGYGSDLFSESFRESIGMPFATSGHNQFVDTLGRSGIIGFSGLLFLYIFLIYYGVKIAYQTKGLSLALITFILINSITAVPIGLNSISVAYMSYYLLLFLISEHINFEKT